MIKNELIQVKNYLDEVFSRFSNLEEFNITEVPIPDTLENNGEDSWFDHYDLKELLKDLENKDKKYILKILNIMCEVLDIYSDWNCEYIEDYEAEMPKEFDDAKEEENYRIYASSASLKKWIENNLC